VGGANIGKLAGLKNCTLKKSEILTKICYNYYSTVTPVVTGIWLVYNKLLQYNFANAKINHGVNSIDHLIKNIYDKRAY
jgi:hypothetical protein